MSIIATMHNASLPNKSTKGLGVFLRALLIFSQFISISFVYALAQMKSITFFIFALLLLVGVAILIFFIEKTLTDDNIIRQTYDRNSPFSLWRFVRLVFLGTGFWVVIMSLFTRGKLILGV